MTNHITGSDWRIWRWAAEIKISVRTATASKGLFPRRAVDHCVKYWEIRRRKHQRAENRKKAAKIANDDRTYARLVHDSAGALNLWGGLQEQVPSKPTGPEIGFDDEAIELAKRGREISQRSVDVSPAVGPSQWGFHRRTHGRLDGQNSSMDPLYQAYYVDVERYVVRWGRTQHRLAEVKRAYEEDKKKRERERWG